MDGFTARRTTNVVPVRTPDPASFRSGLAEGLQSAGRAAAQIAQDSQQTADFVEASEARIAQDQQRRARSAAIADRAGGWAETQVAIEAGLDKLKIDAPSGAPGFEEAAGKIVTDQLQGFLSTLGDDPEVRQRFEPIIASYGANTRLSNQRWAVDARTKHEGQRVDEWRMGASNKLFSTPTSATLQQSFDEADLFVGGMDVPEGAKPQVVKELKRGFVTNFFDGLFQQGNWQGARQLLAGEAFDAYLKPEEKQRFLGQADTAQRVAERQVEIAASEQRDAARDAAKAVGAKIDAGIIPNPQEMRAARAAMVAAGVDKHELIAFDVDTVRVDVNRRYAGVDADRMRRDRDGIEARVRTGKASETEQVMAVQLGKLIDVADKKETDELRGLLGNGPAGRQQALSRLTGSPEARYKKAEDLESGLGFVANLSGNAQSYALEGRETRKARPKDFGEEKDVRAALNRQLGPIAASLGGQYAGLLEASWDIMTAGKARRGQAGFDEGVFRTAVIMATGGKQRPNGVVQGGVQSVRGRPVMLPEAMAAGEFDQYVSRRNFGDAVYANGKPASKADVLANYRPEWAGDDPQGRPVYRFVDDVGGVLRNRNGGSLTMRVEAGR
ncbi:hypothetical protein ACFQ15_05775 [Sphingomonas hankookensis]|uniref:hypothetical protein n=1 Tax=Sphingomonas hankookensis TaxID=563996 RepID=UPI001F591095|nr:hypothetical protein [Sphingomonas hankookensis]